MFYRNDTEAFGSVRLRRLGAGLFAALCVLLLLVGCSQSSGQGEGTGDVGADAGGDDGGGAESAVFTRSMFDSPSNAAELEAQYHEMMLLCMKEAGFEYQNQVFSTGQYYGPRDLKHVQRFGFGYSTQTFSQSVLPNDLAGSEVAGAGSAAQTFVVPGDTPAEREAYSTSNDQCEVDVFEEVRAKHPEVDLIESAMSVLSQVDVTPIHDVIFACAREQGHEFYKTSDLIEAFAPPANELSVQYFNEGKDPGVAVSDEVADALRELQDHETRVAEVFWNCGWFPENLTDETRELWENYEAEINKLISD